MIKFVNKGKGAARPCTVRVTTPDPRKSFDIQLKQSYAGGYVYQFDYVFDKLGDNDFVITIDPQGKLDEFTDLTHRKVFTINVEPLPDLKIEFEHMPEEIEIDKQASFWVSVKNVGNRTSPATKVQFLANNKVVQEKNTKSFEKGGEELLQFKWLPKEKRTYDLIFRVDTDNKIKENFEDNNQCHRKIEVSAPKYNWFIKPNSLMVSPSDPKPGEDARIYFTVENAGQSHEGILYYVLVDDKRIKRSVAWVKPNSRYTVGVDKAVTWRVTGGAHKIKVILNPEKEFPDLGKESIQELSISPKLPMSSVAGLDFMIRKEDISLDMRNLMMIIKVYNRGTKSGVAEVRFYHYRSGKEEPRLRYPAKLFSFPAQSVQTFHLELTPDHYSSKFEIIVDKDNMVKETDEGNNTASYTFPDYEPYKPPPLPERAKAPDLVIDHISIDRSLELGETMSIEIGFGNMNLVDAEGVIVRYEIWNTDRRARDWDAAHGHLKGEKNIGTVKAESRGQFVVDYKGVYPGPYRINVKIDPDRKIKEIDSWFNNNELRKDFSVEGEITPALYFFDKNVDLAIDKEVSVSDSNPSAGTTKVVFKVTARNNSDIVVWGADLDMFIDDELEAGERLGDFPAQSEKTFTFINTFLATGDYTVKFMVDPKEAVPETDEGNNTVTTVIKVKPGIFGTGHRDVAVTSFSLSKTSCLQGEPVTATATIKNVGKDILRAVLCTIGPQGRRPVYVKIQPILAPGQEIKISTTLPALFVGDHIIEARVDGKNLYIETNEENNAKSASLHVEAITKEKVKERVEEKAEEKAGEIIETIDRWLRGLGKP